MNAKTKAILVLEDGSVFRGTSIGASGFAVGEVVFNTAMTGYQEILTDPSYAKQIVTLTYPHIGNTGINQEDYESTRVWGEALVIRDLPVLPSNRRSEIDLQEFLQRENVVAIAGIDTRRLTRHIREHGALAGCVVSGDVLDDGEALAQAKGFPGLSGMDLARVVSRADIGFWQSGVWDPVAGYADSDVHGHHVVAYDFGIKRNILRLLVDRQCQVTVVPATTPANQVLAMRPDGVFLSNGPGDPDPCDYAICAIQAFLEHRIPTFGICLGYQLLALASGAHTMKMPHGHHGANHPVAEHSTKKVLITSQNHGFAVDQNSLPNTLRATHTSLFDGTLQGIERTDVPAFGFQGHPEASPGPHDVGALFDHFLELMQQTKERKDATSH